jgi:mono/diheme cytochrome c family protein
MNKNSICKLVILLTLLSAQIGLGEAVAQATDLGLVARGKYLIVIAGCNDCHTPGYAQSEGKTPEDMWLTGDSFGWRGPWGTTYPTNLRILIDGLTENEWVSMGKNLKARPPMPWFNLNTMQEEDLRAIYQYIRYLGPAGQAAPAYVPADREPAPPFAQFPSPPPQ